MSKQYVHNTWANLWIKGLAVNLVAFIGFLLATVLGVASFVTALTAFNFTPITGMLAATAIAFIVWIAVYLALLGFSVELVNKGSMPSIKGNLSSFWRLFKTGIVFWIVTLIIGAILALVSLGIITLTPIAAIFSGTSLDMIPLIVSIIVGPIVLGWLVEQVDEKIN